MTHASRPAPRIARALLAAAAVALPMAAAQAGEGCPASVFGVAAQIVRVEPPGKRAVKTLPDRQEVSVGVDDLICAGETLEFRGGGATRIEIYVSGGRRELVPSQSFRAEPGVLRFSSQALAFLANAAQGLSSIKSPPEIPRPTAVRGAAGAASAVALQIRAMRLLEDLPRQRLTPDAHPVLSWRDGVAPYECQAISEQGDTTWRADSAVSTSWCVMPAQVGPAVRLLVRDGKSRLVGWNVLRVSWTEVPRPDWIAADASALSPADRTAWAWWLWKSGGPPWRLQALAMLDELAPQEWVAGYLRDNVLAEASAFAPAP